MAKTAAQLQREIDEALAGPSPPRYIAKILSGAPADFVRALRETRLNTYLSAVDCDGPPCLEIGVDEEVKRPLAFFHGIARRAGCVIEVSALS